MKREDRGPLLQMIATNSVSQYLYLISSLCEIVENSSYQVWSLRCGDHMCRTTKSVRFGKPLNTPGEFAVGEE